MIYFAIIMLYILPIMTLIMLSSVFSGKIKINRLFALTVIAIYWVVLTELI